MNKASCLYLSPLQISSLHPTRLPCTHPVALPRGSGARLGLAQCHSVFIFPGLFTPGPCLGLPASATAPTPGLPVCPPPVYWEPSRFLTREHQKWLVTVSLWNPVNLHQQGRGGRGRSLECETGGVNNYIFRI
ncbi:hypothetical protein RRG08_039709 [Elysia crispata]|uniref:Uncharacterized protein n=1 Tax=Elysia crispata TaxID=231223 RepID=A0AAE0Y9Z7_9GAST|nr:hypothetical protein RRG08_039709 [Elysia crispata]